MSKAEQKVQGLSIQHQTILNAVPIGVFWDKNKIFNELHRVTKTKPDHPNVLGVLKKLTDDGIIRKNASGHFQQVKMRVSEMAHIPVSGFNTPPQKPVVLKLQASAPEKKGSAMDRLAAIGVSLEEKSKEFAIFMAATRAVLDDIALEMGQGKQITAEEEKQLEQFRQFKAMLNQ
ncbi:MAG: hypothetical protein IPL86_15960 [Flavobacteriales bacterium]|nr:hypothetical protein [Flavobacteriales bacterium]